MEKISPFYNDAVQQIKSAILESQLETARAANKQMLSLYYAVGKFVSENSREGTWGKGAIDTISAQLRREMPGLRGFSATNIKYMRIFYERWLPVLNRQPTADELGNVEKSESCYARRKIASGGNVINPIANALCSQLNRSHL